MRFSVAKAPLSSGLPRFKQFRRMIFKELKLSKLLTVACTDRVSTLFLYKNQYHFAIHSRHNEILGVVSLLDILFHLAKEGGDLNDCCEYLLGLDMDDESYLCFHVHYEDLVDDAVKRFTKGLHRAVVDTQNGYMLVTQLDILCHVKDSATFQNTISDYTLNVVGCKDTISAIEALEMMKSHKIPCLIVSDKDETPIGCVCPKSLWMLKGSLKGKGVRDLMVKVNICALKSTWRDVVELMVQSGETRVFVSDGKKIIGVVSASDLLAKVLQIGINNL